MTREEAHRLLDSIRVGTRVPLEDINEALMETGDLDSAATTQIRIAAGKWERGAPQLLRRATPFDMVLQ